MLHSIIEIATEGKKLSVYKGFLQIASEEGEASYIPFSDIHAIVITAHCVVYTNNLLCRLCEEKIPLIVLDTTYHPSGMLLPLIGTTKQMELQNIQIQVTKPFKKRLWQSIVQQKIRNQEQVLLIHNKENVLEGFSKQVLSDDSTNMEAQAAKKYFTELFGSTFIRNCEEEGINAFLNYGYAVLRAAISRYIICAGFNPSYSVKHCNKLNPYCLSDDFIEVFRPIVDDVVYRIYSKEQPLGLTSQYKKVLSSLLNKVFPTQEGSSPLYAIMQEYIRSIVRSYRKGENMMMNTTQIFAR